MIICWYPKAWKAYIQRLFEDKKYIKKVNALLHSISRTPYTGIGKPEPLQHNLQGYYSRRISKEHRLVYRIDDDKILITQCRYHY